MSDGRVISRDSCDEKPSRRVWVTGPHFGTDVYSSTEDPAEASEFTVDEAMSLVERKSWRNPLIERRS